LHRENRMYLETFVYSSSCSNTRHTRRDCGATILTSSSLLVGFKAIYEYSCPFKSSDRIGQRVIVNNDDHHTK
jgi:hypothetical protein